MDPSDPWNWTTADIQRFFREDGPSYLRDRIGSLLPPMAQFTQMLSDLDVDGPSLLDTVNAEMLRTEFGLTSVRHRGAVMHCIIKLQKQSPLYQASQAFDAPPQTPTSIFTTPILPQAMLPPAETPITPQAEDIRGNVRPGEEETQDAHGRKRRKLDLTVQAQPPAAPNAPVDTSGYLPDTALTVDEVFYGNTAFGRPIGDVAPTGRDIVQDTDSDKAEDNFAFLYQPHSYGQAEFVYNRVRHFFNEVNNEEILTLNRHGRDAIAVLPYPERLAYKARSATVIQAKADVGDDFIVSREQATLIHHAGDIPALQQELPDAFGEHLLERWRQNSEDSIIDGSDGGDDDGDDSSDGPDNNEDDDDDDRFGSESGAEEVDEKSLEANIISKTIDEEIEKRVQWWQEHKLPKLEAKAWSVWKQTKGSISERDRLVSKAQADIRHLTARIDAQRKAYLAAEWISDDELRRVCQIFHVSVENRELASWKISVWQLRKEPQRTITHRPSHAKASSSMPTSTAQTAPFVMHSDDRMSVSPTAPNHVHVERQDDLANEDDEAADGEQEAFHTPEGSPSPMQDDGFIVPDLMSVDGDEEVAPGSHRGNRSQESGSETMTHDPPSVSAPQVLTSSPPQPVPTSSPRPNDGPGTQALREVVDNMESEDELPSPSSFFPLKSTQSTKQQTPSESRHSGSRDQPLEISSDSADRQTSPEPVIRPKGKGKKNASRTPNQPMKKQRARNHSSQSQREPLEATGDEVDSWNIEVLEEEGDRKRLLVKVLKDLGAEQREELHQLLNSLDHGSRLQHLTAALRTRYTDSAEAQRSENWFSATVRMFADLAMCWYSASYMDFTRDREYAWEDREALSENQSQLLYFLKDLMDILKRKDAKLFKNGPKVINVSDSDSETDVDTPRKRKKKTFQETARGVEARQRARARQDQHTQQLQLESQPMESSQLEGADGASNSSVAINAGSPGEPKPINVKARIAKQMKTHQIEGVRFMWREVVDPQKPDGAGDDGAQGCLLAHTMGLGKTMQTIALLEALVRASESEDRAIRRQLPAKLRPPEVKKHARHLRMLILCPPALLQNWRNEIAKWGGNSLGHVSVVEATKPGAKNSKAAKLNVLRDWHRVGGVLLIGHVMFRNFLSRKKEMSDADAQLQDELESLLLSGPEIVVCDEAHSLKNENSAISKNANRFETETRIGLTGTPMSNDVDEIYALVSWVAPGYLGEKPEFKYKFAQPIKDGTWFDSTRYEIRKSIMKLRVLQHEIEPKVHRADITVLKGQLKPKIEFVITVPLTEAQGKVYERYVEDLVGGGRNSKATQVAIFGWLAVLTLLTNHPSAFRRKLLAPTAKKKGKPGRKKKTEVDDFTTTVGDDDADTTPPAIVSDEVAAEQGIDKDSVVGYGDEDVYALGLTETQVQELLLLVNQSLDPALSAKTKILMEILRLSEACGDQVLLFTHSIPSLDYLEELFQDQGISYGRVDGTMKMDARNDLLDDFNAHKFSVLLVSTRAGGTGLNIQAANRVVIFDFNFNPAWEQQAVGRAYRFGQTKPVFVYRFVAGGTFEAKLYNTQLFKTSLSARVVDNKNPRRNAKRSTREYLYAPRPVKEEDLSQWISKDPNVLDHVLKTHGPGEPGKVDTMIRSIQTMEVLQEEAQDEPLNEEERMEVDQEIQQGKMATRGRRKTTADPTAMRSSEGAETNGMPFRSTMPPRQTSATSAELLRRLEQGQGHGHPTSTAPGVMGPPPSRGNRYAATQAQPVPGNFPQQADPDQPHGLPLPQNWRSQQ
jgi:transcriptional regulator ATRX